MKTKEQSGQVSEKVKFTTPYDFWNLQLQTNQGMVVHLNMFKLFRGCQEIHTDSGRAADI